MNKDLTNNKNLILAIIFIIAAVFIIYLPSLQNGFVNWDDDIHLYNNPNLKVLNWDSILKIFLTACNKVYIPLTLLSFLIEKTFFGLNPFVYHLNNVLLHISVTLMVLFFSLRCGFNIRASMIAAVIFGIHPMHVESVAWVTERKDVLYSFFYMASVLLYCRYLNAPNKNSDKNLNKKYLFVFAAIFGFLSILSKPMALSLPLIFIVCDWFFERKLSLRSIFEKAIIFLIVIPISWVTYQIHSRGLYLSFPKSVLIWLWSFSFYVRKFFFPDTYCRMYEVPNLIRVDNPQYGIAVLVFIILVLIYLIFKENKLLRFSILFYFLSIFFLLRIDLRGDLNNIADRFMYLPSVGFCMLIGSYYDKFIEKMAKNKFYLVILVLISIFFVGFLSYKTIRQCFVWRNGITLFNHQLKYQPRVNTPLMYFKLAEAYSMQKSFKNQLKLENSNSEEVKRVVMIYQDVIRMSPRFIEAYLNLGKIYLALGEIDKAEYNFNQILKLSPKHKISIEKLKVNK